MVKLGEWFDTISSLENKTFFLVYTTHFLTERYNF